MLDDDDPNVRTEQEIEQNNNNNNTVNDALSKSRPQTSSTAAPTRQRHFSGV